MIDDTGDDIDDTKRQAQDDSLACGGAKIRIQPTHSSSLRTKDSTPVFRDKTSRYGIFFEDSRHRRPKATTHTKEEEEEEEAAYSVIYRFKFVHSERLTRALLTTLVRELGGRPV